MNPCLQFKLHPQWFRHGTDNWQVKVCFGIFPEKFDLIWNKIINYCRWLMMETYTNHLWLYCWIDAKCTVYNKSITRDKDMRGMVRDRIVELYQSILHCMSENGFRVRGATPVAAITANCSNVFTLTWCEVRKNVNVKNLISQQRKLKRV